jgi:molybdopterin converting factor small subunit
MVKNFIRSFFGSALERKAEVEIMYFGRVSDALMMTSERIEISSKEYTLEKMLSRLRQRGDRWAYELDNSHVICSINSKKALLSDSIRIGDEVGIFSRKSMFEM